MPIVL